MHELIATVTELTRALSRAVECDDISACDDLIAERGRQFAELDHRLQTCGPEKLAEHRRQLVELAQLDSCLQRKFAAVRDDLGASCRRLGGQSPPRGRAALTLPACIDRKA